MPVSPLSSFLSDLDPITIIQSFCFLFPHLILVFPSFSYADQKNRKEKEEEEVSFVDSYFSGTLTRFTLIPVSIRSGSASIFEILEIFGY